MIEHAARIIAALDWPLIRVSTGRRKNPLVPKGEDWKHKKFHVKPTPKVLRKAARGDDAILGFVMPEDIVCLDFDDMVAFERFNASVAHDDLRQITLCVRSGRGYHIYFKRSKDRRVRNYKGRHPLFADIDVRTNGMMIAPPSMHYLRKRNYMFLDNGHTKPRKLPKSVLSVFFEIAAQVSSDPVREDTGDYAEPAPGELYITKEQLRTALDALPVAAYDNELSLWFELLASIHHATRGAKWARDMWLEWAAGSEGVTSDEHGIRYNSKEGRRSNLAMWNSCDV